MIGFLVLGRVRIKIRSRVRVRVRDGIEFKTVSKVKQGHPISLIHKIRLCVICFIKWA